MKFFLFGIILLASIQPCHASGIKKGFEALLVKDYFKAKKLFSKGLKYNPESASYGLAIVYSRNEHPFYSKDSAYRYILKADSSWALAKQRKKDKLKIYGWTREGIDSMKIVISTQFYVEAKGMHTVANYTTFIQNHPWASQYEQAIDTRDSLAFFEIMKLNSAEAYDEFISKYPDSKFIPFAEDNFYNSQYVELTGDGSLSSYLKFIEEHPESPMFIEAERKVFEMVTEPNDSPAYELFVLGYADNSFVNEAWKQFYQVYLFDYSKARMTDFMARYPENPIRKEIVADIVMADSLLLPFADDDKYGYINTEGEIVYAPTYDYAGPFKNGLAAVAKDEKYGFINKKGELQVPFEFENTAEFVEGHAIVEKGEYLGMIDRNYKVLLSFEYEEIGEPSNGLVFTKKGEKYGYADLNGNAVIPAKFDEAFDFIGKYAMVEVDEKQAMINARGEYMIAPLFERLTPISDTLFVAELDGRKGIVTENGTFVVSPLYDQIGEFHEGLALVSKSDTIEYINVKGEVVISKGFKTFPNFLMKGEFNNGSAIVYNKKGKYGRINVNGDVITDFEYQNLGIGQKFIPFSKQDFWGLLSLSNKVLISAKYDALDLLDNRYVLAELNDSLGVMDVNGNTIIPFKYNSVKLLRDDLFVVRLGNLQGIYKADKLVLNAEYEQIGVFNDDFVFLVKDSKLYYYDLVRNKLIQTSKGDE